jgi:hypothetical protein
MSATVDGPRATGGGWRVMFDLFNKFELNQSVRRAPRASGHISGCRFFSSGVDHDLFYRLIK